MTRDEMKDRISMALKDPVLQQGFEIICKENAELKEKVGKYQIGMFDEIEKRDKQLTKAKEIIKTLIDTLTAVDGEQISELKVVKEAEQFLNSEVEK